jgi:hypothetical protein
MEFKLELDLRAATILFTFSVAHLGKQGGIID